MPQVVDYIDGEPTPGLARLQQVEKGVLASLLAFCQRHELQPFLVAGSALGAVRHGDIIPWDDDIDVGLVRADYERLIDLLMQDPIPGFFIQSHRSERNYPHAYAKLRRENSAVHEAAFEGAAIRDGIFIDIFPFDHVPASRWARKLQSAQMIGLNVVIMSFSKHAAEVSRNAPMRALRKAAFVLRPILPWRWLIPWRERAADPRLARRSGKVASFEMYGIMNAERTVIAVDSLLPPATASFGDLTVPVPRDADGYLTALFGDYRQMPPVASRKPLHVRAVEFE